MPMTRTPLFALALALAGAACTHRGATTPSTPQASTAATPSQDMDAMCPMNVPGTKVSAEDTATGAAFTFTTTPDQVQALRDRVSAMAEMHNRHHAAMGEHGSMQGSAGAGGMHGDAQGSAGMHGSMHGGAGTEGGAEGMGMPVAARASAEDVDGGARLVLTPNDPADLPKLQSMVRAHAEHMEQSGCPMMHGKHGA
jgi:hypothetical protein